MAEKIEDKGIRAVRDVRKKISTEFDNDPQKLVEHYIAEQEKHRDRLLRPATTQQRSKPDPKIPNLPLCLLWYSDPNLPRPISNRVAPKKETLKTGVSQRNQYLTFKTRLQSVP